MIKSLFLKNFRIYEEARLVFAPGVNGIVGPNARGKTTILEAIYLLISGKSFRTEQLKELIRHGEEYFFVEAEFEKLGIEQHLKFAYDGVKRRISYNNTLCKSAANLYGILQGVAMTPDDVAIVKEGPALRRQFLDIQLAQVDPLYVHHSTRYQRALKQRNLLLKKRAVESIESWEAEMAKAAAYIVRQRRGVVPLLEQAADAVQQRLSKRQERLSLKYKSSAPEADLEEYYRDMWKRHRPRELDAKMTLNGPHRDDLLIAIDGQEARRFGSEGQQRSAVVSLKLAGWEQLKKRSDTPPLMLVDDVGVSLDADRREQLFSHLSGLSQVFLTSTEAINKIDSFCPIL